MFFRHRIEHLRYCNKNTQTVKVLCNHERAVCCYVVRSTTKAIVCKVFIFPVEPLPRSSVHSKEVMNESRLSKKKKSTCTRESESLNRNG